jgi:hypothetical protein
MAAKTSSKKLGRAKSLQEVKPLTTAQGGSPNLFKGCGTGSHIANGK